MVRTKVFVGNLSFKTRESELATEFGQHAKVVSANIITRGPRSLGYGFVELESEEDANKAVAAMNKKEIDGRPINVEVARERVEGESAPETGADAATGSPSTRGRGGARGAARGTRGGRGRGGARGGRGGATGSPKVEGEATGSPSTTPKERAPRVKKERTPREPAADRKSSQTSLFVANLPFSLTDETFGKLFTEAGLKFKTAHVVTKRNDKSKGFGFVEFESQEEQQKALTTMNGKKVEDRELAVRVALEAPEGVVAAATGATSSPKTTASPKPAAKAATPTTEAKTN